MNDPIAQQALEATLAHTRTHRDIVVGDGAPTHNAREGTLYWDKTNDQLYVNSDGATTWQLIGGASHPALTLAADADALLSLSTQELGLDTQLANLVFAGPTSGGAADPTFRALVAADIPAGFAPSTADYLVGTAQGGLSAEIVVGTTPGGELGGTWASPTVDATHSGSAHHAESHTLTSHSTRAHSELTGVGATDHHSNANDHAQSHTVASHSDTTATGAELETLTDGSNADALHSHAAGGGSMTTVKHSGVQVGGADIVTLDFGTGLAVTETPDTEINVDIDDPLTLSQYNVVDTNFELLVADAGNAPVIYFDRSGTLDYLGFNRSANQFTFVIGTTNTPLALTQSAVSIVGTAFIKEQAAAAADIAGWGQLWVKNDAPNTLWFTDDAGTDHQLGVGGGAHAMDDGTHTDVLSTMTEAQYDMLIWDGSQWRNSTSDAEIRAWVTTHHATARPVLGLRRSRGTQASPTAVQSGDVLGNFNYQGHDGSAFGGAAAIIGYANENWTGSAHGARLQFEIVGNGGTSTTAVATIGGAGQLALPVAGSGAGILMASDAGFYRRAADIVSTFAGDDLQLGDNDKLSLGDGGPGVDVDMYWTGSEYRQDIAGVSGIKFGATGLIINDDAAGIDLRIETVNIPKFFFIDASADRAAIGGNDPPSRGYIGIATDTADDVGFAIQRHSSSIPAWYFGANSSDEAKMMANGNFASRFGKIVSGAFTEYMSIGSNGRIGMEALDVGTSVDVQIHTTGNYLLRASSSARYKKSIRDLEDAEVAAFMQLRPRAFNYRANTGTPNAFAYGLIAEEVDAVMPALVTRAPVWENEAECQAWAAAIMEYEASGKTGTHPGPQPRRVYVEGPEPDGVRYRELSVLLLRQVQKMKQENEALTQRVATLEARR